MNRVFYHYKDLEETYSNLWKTGSENDMITKSLHLLSERKSFKNAVKKMLSDWKKSAIFNLTNESQNRIAWIGQATCSHAHGATNGETKEAWSKLTEDQKLVANNVAFECLSDWEESITPTLFNWMEETS